MEWWGGERREGREEGGNAWKVPAIEIEKAGFNLDISNPHAGEDLDHRSPEELVNELIKTESEIVALLEELREETGGR